MPKGIFDWESPYKGLQFHAAKGDSGGGGNDDPPDDDPPDADDPPADDVVTMTPRQLAERLARAGKTAAKKAVDDLGLPDKYNEKLAYAEEMAAKKVEDAEKLDLEKGEFEKLRLQDKQAADEKIALAEAKVSEERQLRINDQVHVKITSALLDAGIQQEVLSVGVDNIARANSFDLQDGKLCIVDAEGHRIMSSDSSNDYLSIDSLANKFLDKFPSMRSSSSGSGIPGQTTVRRAGKRDFRAELRAAKTKAERTRITNEMNATL